MNKDAVRIRMNIRDMDAESELEPSKDRKRMITHLLRHPAFEEPVIEMDEESDVGVRR